MSRAATLAIVLSCLVVGFAAGRITAPEQSNDERAAGETSRDPELARNDASLDPRRERPTSRPGRTDVARVGGEKPTTRKADARDGSPSSAADSAGEGKEAEAPEEPSFERAMELLAVVEEALENGDAETLAEVRDSVSVHGEFMVTELTALLQDADSLFAKENLARLLGSTGDLRALPALQELLEQEKDAEVRTAAITALGDIPDPSSVPLLAAEFTRESDSPMPPSLAATSLGKIGTPESVVALKKEIADGTNRMVRAFSLAALSELKEPDLVPFFLEQARRVEGTSERYRKQAIDAVAGTGDASAIPQLEEIAFSKESGQSLQEAAKRAINTLAGETIYDIR